MAGGLLQLVAVGSQDSVLTGSPTVTYFRVVHRRHTQFAIESIENTFSGVVGYGKRSAVTISRNGDLVIGLTLEITLKKGTGATHYPAEALLASAEIEIGGQKIDKIYNDWMRVNDHLFRDDTEKAAYKRCVDWVDGEPTGHVKRFFVPLDLFWFTKNVGNALPLISLQFHELKLFCEFANANANVLPGVDLTYEPTASLWVDYVFLAQEERRKYATTQQEFLVQQLQFSGAEGVTIGTSKATRNIRLSLNHPTSFLAWVVKGPKYGQFSANSESLGEKAEALAPLYDAKLLLNGQDRFATRRGSYFNYYTSYQSTRKCNPGAGVYMYSFALKPHESIPTGQLNFSRIDTATLQLTFKAANASAADISDVLSEEYTTANATQLTDLLVYGVNFNILRVLGGMAGLAYSN
jgi:hypothetical protein